MFIREQRNMYPTLIELPVVRHYNTVAFGNHSLVILTQHCAHNNLAINKQYPLVLALQTKHEARLNTNLVQVMMIHNLSWAHSIIKNITLR